jgi:hypothetical protein
MSREVGNLDSQRRQHFGLQYDGARSPAIDVLNFDQLKAIDRSKGMDIEWNLSGYSKQDRVRGSLGQAPGFGSPGFQVACSAAATDGGLVIPQSAFDEVPASPGLLFLTVQPINTSMFSIPREDGASITVLFRYLSQNSINPRIM